MTYQLTITDPLFLRQRSTEASTWPEAIALVQDYLTTITSRTVGNESLTIDIQETF